MTSTTTPVESTKLKTSRKLLAGVALLLGAVMVVVLFSHRGIYKIYCQRQDRISLDQENARLAEENDRLARTIDRLQHDPEMIQDLIRRELNFVKKNEIIFQLPPGSRKKPPVTPAAPNASAPGEPHAKAETSPDRGKIWAWDTLEGGPKSGSPSHQ